MFQHQIAKISVEAIYDKSANGENNHSPLADVTSLKVYIRQGKDERRVSLERELGDRWISPEGLSMALDRSDLEIVAFSRSYGELGFVTIARDQLLNGDDSLAESITKQFAGTATALESTALWVTLDLDKTLFPSSQASPVLLEIDRAIEQEQKALSCPTGSVEDRYTNLGTLFSRRFTYTKDLSDLRQAIFSIETSIDMAMEASDNTPDGKSSCLAERLSKLADFLTQCFEATGDPLDLDELIEVLGKAVARTPTTELDRLPARLNNLSNALQNRFDLSQDIEDIHEAVSNLSAAVESTPETHGNLPTLLSNLGSALLRRFDSLKDLHDLQEAIANHLRAIDLSKHDHPERRYWLSKVGLAYQRRFEHLHELSDIEESIKFKKLAMDVVEELDGHLQYSKDLSAALQSVAYGYYLSFKTTQKLGDLEDAISFQQRSFDITPPGSDKTLPRLKNLSSFCDRCFLTTRSKEHLSKALAIQQTLIDHIKRTKTDASLPEHLDTLGNWLHHRFQYSQDVSDIEQAVLSHRDAVGLAPASPEYLSSLARSLRLQFDLTQNLKHIEEAVALARKANSLTAESEASARARRLHELARCLNSRNEVFVDLEGVEEAVLASQLSVDLTSKDDKDGNGRAALPMRLVVAGIALQHRYQRTRLISDLYKATSMHEEAASLVSDTDPRQPFILNALCAALQRQYDTKQDLEVIERVITTREKMVTTEESKRGRSDDLSSWIAGLANALHQKFQRTGRSPDIDEAIATHRKAIAFTSPTDPQLRKRLTNLATSLKSRADMTRKTEDLDEAVGHLENARKLTPESHRLERSAQYLALGVVHQARFQRANDPIDILFSIEYLKESIELISPAIESSSGAVALHQNGGLSSRLHNLGISLRLRFERHGDLSDIQEAINAQQKVARMTPSDHADYPIRLTSLGNSFLSRYARTKDRSDLEEAIELQKRAVSVTPIEHPQHPARLMNLSLALRTRAELTRQMPDFDQAITVLETARNLESAGNDPALLSDILDSLGNVFHAKYRVSKCLDDIQEAISLRRKAIPLLSNHPTSLLEPLNNLGTSLHYLYYHTKEIEHLEESIATLQRALDTLPADSPQADLRFSVLINLSNAQEKHYYHSKDTRSRRQAASNMQMVVIHRGLSPWSRIQISKRLAHLTRGFDQGICLYAYKVCIKLMAEVGGLEQTIQRRHSALASISDITLEAAAAAVEFGVPQVALEWLEQGRCLVWTQLNSLRTPVDSIRSIDPSLADRLAQLSPLLERMGSRRTDLETGQTLDSPERKILLQEDVVSHLNLAQDWEEALADVRALDGFEDFLKIPPVEEWFSLIPPSSAIIVINVHETRCDALILSSGTRWPQHLELPQVSHAMVEDWRAKLQRSLVAEGVRLRGYDGGIADDDESADTGRGIRPRRRVGGSTNMLEYVLKQLWIRVVLPIVEKLSLKISKDKIPGQRVWWCPTGSLSFLPLHAAGNYGSSDSVSMCDYAVSSYIPTLSSLLERLKAKTSLTPPSMPAGSRKETLDMCRRGVLLISEHDAPGFAPIPGVKAEINAIRARVGQRGLPTSTLGGDTNIVATVEAGISSLNKYTCVHLACHATQDVNEPLKSGFHLHDGPLDLSMVVQANLTFADLAFLSACQTSAGDEQLSEEAVHLAAGMLAAGYRGVVGTRWSIQDRYASEIAESFYDHLLIRSSTAGVSDIDGKYAAEALHHAISQGIRQKLGDTPQSLLVWVPYVHFGL
ncbi:hypothetical protein MD484_g8150, partial [Candolleomyces efflorescens]